MNRLLRFVSWIANGTVAFAALLPCVAHADASARAYLGDERISGQVQPPYVHGPTEATSQAGAAGSGADAYAYANLETGVLRVIGHSLYAPPYVTTSDASTAITDTVTFSGGIGQTAYLDYAFDGSLGIVQDAIPKADIAQMMVYVATVAGSSTRYETLSGYIGNCGTGVNCQVGTSTARTGSVAFQIYAGPTSFSLGLYGSASIGNSFDFGHTAKFYLRVPGGVGYTSVSGDFLAAATPIFVAAQVPEPSTCALMGVGLGLFAWARTFRRTRAEHAFGRARPIADGGDDLRLGPQRRLGGAPGG